MKVLYAAAEMYPLVKVGGLGDVAGSLPAALLAEGIDVTVVLPAYSFLGEEGFKVMYRAEGFHFLRSDDFAVPVVMIRMEGMFEGDGAYDGEELWKRFDRFSRGASVLADRMNVDVLHANDWHAAVTLAYQAVSQGSIRKVLSIHNLEYQGIFSREILPEMGPGIGSVVEGERCVNFLLCGIKACDAMNVVSESYAREVLTPEYGWGLDGVMRENTGKLCGITNGLDGDTWDPSRDRMLVTTYDRDSIHLKAKNRMDLAEAHGLSPELPILGMVSRLAGQKGIDILLEALPMISEFSSTIILGTGEKEMEERLGELSERNDNISVVIGYDEAEAHRIYSGADFFLMPSRFEPCGLGQLIAMRYGTIPLVRRTGGLIDTVKDVSENGWGILFTEYSSGALVSAVERATELYGDMDKMYRARRAAMAYDSSWSASAKRYIDMYRSIVD